MSQTQDFYAMPTLPNRSRRRHDAGFVLIASLLILVVLTIIAVAMFRSFGLQELMAGNLREKTRAIEAANSALSYAEWWLNQNNTGTGVSCTAAPSPAGATRVCSNQLSSPATLSNWVTASTYTLPNSTVSTSGGQGTYYASPQFYIQYLGPDATKNATVYLVTALGYGGNANAVAVVQSTYAFTAIKDLTGP
jgi:type IV pilus assembly protein PilX